jgi:conjugative relaxase-like TrwC/TraI family protein
VLKIHVVRQGGHLYYVNDLVPGRAEGTLVAGEAPGAWSGAGAATLGVTGPVETQAFAELLDGRDPWSGTALRSPRGHRSVSGYDLTFCAPKSVSLLHLLAPREMAGEVGAGHQAAVADATDYLQRVGVAVRRTRGGQVSLLPSTGMVAGQFLHRTSRALDPHLHTHLVVANVAQGVDGAWSAVDSRRVFAHARATQGVYHARLRMELSDRLGAAWEVPPSGLGDVIGVEPRMRRLFSQRSASIDEYVARRVGRATAPSRTTGAFHATRPDKDRTRTVEWLEKEWKERARDFGFDLGDLTRVVGLGREARSGPKIDSARVCLRLDQLALHHRSVAHRDVVAVIAGACTGGTRAQVIESVATRVVEASGVPLSGDHSPGPAAADFAAYGKFRAGCSFEPRWAAADVAGAVGGRPDELLAPARQRAWVATPGRQTPERGSGLPGRDWSRDRSVDGTLTAGEVQFGR